jgi:structure-specific recognition protein 1
VKGLACSVKANDGHLYPMEKGFMFLHKPPIHIRYDDVASVMFDRVTAARGEASRTFDFTVGKISLNSG